MKKYSIVSLVCLIMAIMSLSLAAKSSHVPFNRVSFQIQERQWATTKTAKVVVSVAATLSHVQLVQMQHQIMQRLGKLAAEGDWHITSFNRTQDKSGLEQLLVIAEARLQETKLNGLRSKAKSISKPGETYTIQAIQFTPSLEEIEATREQLRDKIYQQVNQELARLNKVYPEQHYYVHQINFNGSAMPMSRRNQPVMFESLAAKQTASNASNLSVSNQILETAQVILAANVQGISAPPPAH